VLTTSCLSERRASDCVAVVVRCPSRGIVAPISPRQLRRDRARTCQLGGGRTTTPAALPELTTTCRRRPSSRRPSLDELSSSLDELSSSLDVGRPRPRLVLQRRRHLNGVASWPLPVMAASSSVLALVVVVVMVVVVVVMAVVVVAVVVVVVVGSWS
jgi:hypothetical protein